MQLGTVLDVVLLGADVRELVVVLAPVLAELDSPHDLLVDESGAGLQKIKGKHVLSNVV